MPNVFGFRRPQAFAAPQTRTSESKEHWQLYICSVVPATWCGFGIMEVPGVRPRQQDFASNFTWKTTSKDAEDDE
jgi:hypothetical protein